jgi:competence protein CoiA
MLSARRISDGHTVTAYLESKKNGPFACLECGDTVALKTCKSRINHFAHVDLQPCQFARGESDTHRKCKTEIYEALSRQPNVTDVVLERVLGTVRPDVSAFINGIPVAIEVQISSLSIETIMHRTIEYHRKGIYVLWLLQWKPALDAPRYTPKLWEIWLHAAYFGRVYYWIGGQSVVSYHFDADFKTVPQTSWYSKEGKKMTGGGYSRKSKRYRRAIRGKTLNIAANFSPRERYLWANNEIVIPDARLLIDGEEVKPAS